MESPPCVPHLVLQLQRWIHMTFLDNPSPSEQWKRSLTVREREGVQQRPSVQVPQVRGRYNCAVEHPAKVILTGS